MIGNLGQGLIIVVIEVMCCRIFLNTFLKSRFYENRVIRLLLMTATIIVAFLNSVFLAPYMYFKIFSYIFIMSLFMSVYFKSSYIKTSFLVLVYQVLMIVIDYMAVIGIEQFLPEEQKLKLSDMISGTLLVLVCRLILFLIIMLIKKKWSNDEDKLSLISTSEWLRFLYFPILSIVAILAMLLDTQKNLLVAFGLVIMNIILFYLLEGIIEREIKIQNAKIFQERRKNETNMYRSVSQNLEEQRKRVHEYKNQMMCLEGMLENGENQAALNYLHKFITGYNTHIDVIDTNHIIANAVLNSKYKEAIAKNIVVVLKVSDLSKIILEDEDIVTILSNLLNNAIEACEKVKDKKIIKLKIAIERKVIVISVKNTIKEPIKIVNNKIQTTKSNKKEHGFGIVNIQSTVKKYKGTSVLKCENGYFSFSIVIPC